MRFKQNIFKIIKDPTVLRSSNIERLKQDGQTDCTGAGVTITNNKWLSCIGPPLKFSGVIGNEWVRDERDPGRRSLASTVFRDAQSEHNLYLHF